MAVWTSEHYTLHLIDGASTEVEVTPSDFQVTVPGFVHGDRELTHLYDREAHLEAVRGRVKQYEISVEIHQDGPIYSATSSTVLDMIRGTGSVGGGASVDPGAIVRALHMELRGTRLTVSQVVRFTRCYIEADWSLSMEGNKLAIKGTCVGGITIT